jgi:KDO2-lipid IV(A) lauroyltransferase
MVRKTRMMSSMEYGLATLFVALVRRLPYRLSQRLGAGLGSIAHRLLGNRRSLTRKNLAFVFPDRNPAQIRKLSRKAFQNIGRTLVEFVCSAGWTKEKLMAQIEIEGREHLDNALGKGSGILFLSAHFGNWELMGMAVSSLGYKLRVIARPMDNPKLDLLVNRMRANFGEGIIASVNGVKDVIRSLRRNETIGVLMDHNLRENPVFADFFHKPAATTPILPLLAKKIGAPIVPIHMVRLGDGRHRIIREKELVLQDAGDHRQYLEINTRLCNRTIESWILKDPEQWFWVHDRWKTRPGPGNSAHRHTSAE